MILLVVVISQSHRYFSIRLSLFFAVFFSSFSINIVTTFCAPLELHNKATE
jgi:hypothetical protein